MAPIKKNRRVQRLQLDPPLPAHLGSGAVKLLDLSLYGACIEHFVPISTGSTVKLTIDGKSPVELRATVTRCVMRLDRGVTIYRSGLAFVHFKEIVPPRLKEVLIQEIYKAIALWKANARGVLPKSIETMPIFHPDDALSSVRTRKKATNFVWYRLVRGEWNVSVTFDPNQPLDGFAVSADDDQSEMEQLQKTYEMTDEAGRQLIRMLAHLSIADAS